jgi:hypothetical protein
MTTRKTAPETGPSFFLGEWRGRRGAQSREGEGLIGEFGVGGGCGTGTARQNSDGNGLKKRLENGLDFGSELRAKENLEMKS